MSQDSTASRPRVSVIMSVYDGVRIDELREATQSITSQTYDDFEFLILKDGIERNDLIECLQDFAAKDARIRLLQSIGRRGIACSLNTLARAAVGEYVIRMDADDISVPVRIERQVDFLDKHPEVQLLGTNALEVDSAGVPQFEKRMPEEEQAIRRFMCGRDPFIHPTVAFRRSFFERVGYYDERPSYSYLEDTELWSRALLTGCGVANLPEFLLHFRVNDTFFQRRRGRQFIWNEWALRTHYARNAGLPLHTRLRPIGVMLIRLCPATVLRWAYHHCRT